MEATINVLIVEDLPTDAELNEREVRQVLPHSRFMRVETREEFLAALESFHPDLILCDYKLPRFDGLTALDLACGRIPETPFIIVTGSINEDTAVECMKAGAWDYVIKEHIRRLQTAVNGCFEKKALRREQKIALEKSRRWERVFEKAHFGLGHADPATNTFIEVNPTFARERGYAPNELVGRSILDVYAADERETMKKRFNDIDNQGHLVFETKHVRKDDSTFPVLMEVTTIKDDDGRPISRIAYALNITQIKQSEHQLRSALAEAQRLREALDRVPSYVYMKDQKSRYIYANKTTLELFGCSAEELINNDDSHFFPPATVEQLKSIDARVFAGEQTAEEVYVNNPANGQRVYWEVKTPIYEEPERKKIPALLGISTDITLQKQTEKSLRESEQQLRLITENMRDMIWLMDMNFRTTWISPSVFRGRGFTLEELASMRLEGHLTQESLNRVLNMAAVQLTSEKLGDPHLEISFSDEFECFRKDGSTLWTETTITLLRDPDGEPTGLLGVARDITYRKKAEEEREKLQAQLLHAQKMESIGRLAGGVAHDYNNMLSVILGYTEMAIDQVNQSDPLHADLMEIYTAGKRSMEITGQLLAFARKQIINPRVIDLNKTMEGMLKMLRRLIGEDIDLEWHPAARVWPVKMDPFQIDQILANLCVNARDAISGVGKMTIETKNIVLDADYCAHHAGFIPGEYVMLAVSDTGCGMDRETLESIFEPFFTTKEVGKGTGLGMATVYGIVKQNNGFVNVYSEPEKGTTFRIYLLRHVGESEDKPTERIAEIIPGRGETILLVEDEPVIITMGKLMLKKLGYQSLAASSPGEAIRLASEHGGEIHLLLTDVVMPKMNGKDLADQLKSRYPHLKVLFMSGYTADAVAHHGILEKGVHFIQKPFSQKELAAKLRAALD